MKKVVGRQRIDTVFVLIIFCVFAVSVLMVLMLGASIYQNMTEISREEQDEHTVLSYIRTKVRNNDENAMFSVGDFRGLPALYYEEEFYGTYFRTYIYHYNGWVFELFSEVGIDFYPEDGVAIMPLNDLSFEELEYGLIRIFAGTRSLTLYPRSSASAIVLYPNDTEEVIIG